MAHGPTEDVLSPWLVRGHVPSLRGSVPVSISHSHGPKSTDFALFVQLGFTQGDTLKPGHPAAGVPEPGDLFMDAARQALPNSGDCRGAAGETRYPKHWHIFGEGPKTITRNLLNKPRGYAEVG